MDRTKKARKLAIVFVVLYIVNKLYKRWKHSKKLFSEKKDIANKVILITGCDSGFGKATALKLSISLGYKVIATCLKEESVQEYLSNPSYTQNESTATVLNVLKSDHIKRVKLFTITYLKETNSVLWGIVNNAGYSIPGPFEIVSSDLSLDEHNVLYIAPLNIIRTLLPLLYGRKDYNNKCKFNNNNGGRIVNVASAAAHCYFSGDIRYGPAKTALSYFSHVLRMELSPRFGIWVSAVEPGGYITNIISDSKIWFKKVQDKLRENKQTELLNIYDSPKQNQFNKGIEYIEKGGLGYSTKIEQVVDCIIHGLTAKYPQRSYQPNWTFLIKFLAFAPIYITEPFQLWLIQFSRKQMKKL